MSLFLTRLFVSLLLRFFLFLFFSFPVFTVCCTGTQFVSPEKLRKREKKKVLHANKRLFLTVCRSSMMITVTQSSVTLVKPPGSLFLPFTINGSWGGGQNDFLFSGSACHAEMVGWFLVKTQKSFMLFRLCTE
jgi:hypothetical protein